jgi:hypothetical protein
MYSTGLAYLLWFISGFGALGFHRFYLGKIPTGLLWMLTGGLGMFGAIFDFFTLPGQVREANMRNAITNGNRNVINVVSDHSGNVRGKESVERVVLRLAKENKGIISASELALSANIPIEDAKRDLEALVSKGFAELRVRRSGALAYVIPDMMNNDDPLEDI